MPPPTFGPPRPLSSNGADRHTPSGGLKRDSTARSGHRRPPPPSPDQEVHRMNYQLTHNGNELDLLTLPEAAKLLRISRNLAYELVARHEIPAIRLGRVIRVPKQG